MSIHLSVYEELYCISDLHLGGTGSVRMFDNGEVLSAMIQHLAGRQPLGGGVLALVLNGDVIDSLAEDIDEYIAFPVEAAQLMERLFKHGAFKDIWKALAEFVSAPNHLLLIAVGNHDIELAYHHVQEQIRQELAKQDEVKRGRIVNEWAGAATQTALLDSESDNRAAKVWALASILELAVLYEEERADRIGGVSISNWATRLGETVSAEGFPLYSTLRQLSRYRLWQAQRFPFSNAVVERANKALHLLPKSTYK